MLVLDRDFSDDRIGCRGADQSADHPEKEKEFPAHPEQDNPQSLEAPQFALETSPLALEAFSIDFTAEGDSTRSAMIKVTYYLEVISSWCYWAEPAWAELKKRYAEHAEFEWKLALMDASGLPTSREQLEWFYRRSGTIVRSPFKLNPGWFEPGVTEYIVPNLVAEAARDLGVTDDRVRLAISEAALREGMKMHRLEECAAVAASAGELNLEKLKKRAEDSEIEQRARRSTAEFHAMQVSQRPTFVVQSEIGDKAVFSGIWSAAPVAATIEAMLQDQAAYKSWAVHIGPMPA